MYVLITHFHSCFFLTFPLKLYLYKKFKLSIKDYLLLIYMFMFIIIFLRIIILSFQSHQTQIFSAGLGMAWNRYELSCNRLGCVYAGMSPPLMNVRSKEICVRRNRSRDKKVWAKRPENRFPSNRNSRQIFCTSCLSVMFNLSFKTSLIFWIEHSLTWNKVL